MSSLESGCMQPDKESSGQGILYWARLSIWFGSLPDDPETERHRQRRVILLNGQGWAVRLGFKPTVHGWSQLLRPVFIAGMSGKSDLWWSHFNSMSHAYSDLMEQHTIWASKFVDMKHLARSSSIDDCYARLYAPSTSCLESIDRQRTWRRLVWG